MPHLLDLGVCKEKVTLPNNDDYCISYTDVMLYQYGGDFVKCLVKKSNQSNLH